MANVFVKQFVKNKNKEEEILATLHHVHPYTHPYEKVNTLFCRLNYNNYTGTKWRSGAQEDILTHFNNVSCPIFTFGPTVCKIHSNVFYSTFCVERYHMYSAFEFCKKKMLCIII